ncbi:MAG: DNA helicase RecQ [Anaerolineae bacterium]|nr:DNA helicase RecQ [Anaerolineae bacterium]
MLETPIYTIGYGARPLPDFIALLQSYQIVYLIDVRSQPYSRHRPEFGKQPLAEHLPAQGIRYVFMGHNLGGKPADERCYTDGKIDYDKLAQMPFYQEGIGRVRQAYAQQLPVALLCAEEKPEQCHRALLIGKTLTEMGIPVAHIDEHGRLRSQTDLLPQPALFTDADLCLNARWDEWEGLETSIPLDEWYDAPTEADISAPLALALPTGPRDLGMARQLLKTIFGYDEFRPLQAEIIENLLHGRDSLTIMPTGSGKSLCYQLPALLFDGLTVVVSPLISLMEDQVSQLREVGVPAAYLNSTLPRPLYNETMDWVRHGRVKLLYAAPETLTRPDVLALLAESQVACLTIDEAHCISQWGHDFRPEYRQLIDIRRRLPQAVCVGLTATATPRVRQDILASLGIPQAQEFIASFNRENLFLSVQPKTDLIGQTLSFLEDHRDESGIIYCATRKQVDLLTGLLQAKGWAARPYHAGLDDATRYQNQRAFIRDDVPIIVATIAFGMGINKPNVRFVLHADLPQDVESYYQQIGRAGRDGLRADCLLLYSYADVSTVNFFIDKMPPELQKGASLRLAAMVQYAEAGVCRRRPLLTYFGEPYEAETCDTCDNCLAEEQAQVDLTTPAQKFLSCIYRTGQFFGVNHIIDVLRGSRNQKILQRGHDKLSTYGIGLEWDKEQWKHFCTQLIQQGLIVQDLEHGSLKLTETAWPVLRGQAQFFGVMETARAKTAVAAPAEPLDYNRELFALLRQKRKELADAANVPPYVIFSDRTLVEMAAFYPQSRESLARIYGIGQRKLETYADLFLPLIQEFCVAHGLAEAANMPEMRRASRPEGSKPPGARAQMAVEMYEKGKAVPEIADELAVKTSTVLKYLVEAVRGGRLLPPDNFRALSTLSADEQTHVLSVFAELGPDFLRPVFDALGETVSFEELHILRLVYLCEQKR